MGFWTNKSVIVKGAGSGIIVNTASAAGFLGLPGMSAYSMSKFAIVGLTKSLRFEGAECGVQISALCPTAIETPLIDGDNAPDTGQIWRPNIREYLTEVGGPPYPVDKFVDYALQQIERNQGIIIAPLGARLRLTLARFFASVVDVLTRHAYRKQLAQRK